MWGHSYCHSTDYLNVVAYVDRRFGAQIGHRFDGLIRVTRKDRWSAEAVAILNHISIHFVANRRLPMCRPSWRLFHTQEKRSRKVDARWNGYYRQCKRPISCNQSYPICSVSRNLITSCPIDHTKESSSIATTITESNSIESIVQCTISSKVCQTVKQ